MKYRSINLSRKPFVNARPVVRATMVLWGIGAILMLLNGILYGRSLVGMEDRKERLASAEADILVEEERFLAARQSVIDLELGDQNEEAGFLQDRFEERRFPWSRLFGQLAGVLPKDVRLFRIRPEGLERGAARASRQARSGAEAPRQTWLRIAGEAKSDQALVDLLDALFSDPAFGDPQLPGESRESDGSIRFSLSTSYFPDANPVTLAGPGVATSAAGGLVADSGGELSVGDPRAGGALGSQNDRPSAEPDGSTAAGGITAPGSTPGAQRRSSGAASGSRRAGGGGGPTTTRDPVEREDRVATDGSSRDTEPRNLAPNASTPGVVN